MGLTPGHDTAEDIHYRTFDPDATSLRCFRCHSTGPLSLGPNYTIQPSEPGIHCESCHGPGSGHVKSGGRPGTLLNPAQLSAAGLNDFCGVCHRNSAESDWTDKWKTRHQPSYLAQSACFRNSNGALTCLTCHDPHGPLNEVAAQYDKLCIECHKTVRHTATITARSCVDCHMPQVAVSDQLKFTNHWIGIYARGGAKLVPARSVAKNAPPLAPDGPEASCARGPCDTSRPLFEQAFADNEKEFGANDPRVARSAADLGLFWRQGRRCSGRCWLTALRRALEIDERNSAAQAAEDAENLGGILAGFGRNNEAFVLFRQASTASLPKTAARAFANLAIVDSAHAEEYYAAAIAAERRSEDPDSKRIASTLNTSGAPRSGRFKELYVRSTVSFASSGAGDPD